MSRSWTLSKVIDFLMRSLIISSFGMNLKKGYAALLELAAADLNERPLLSLESPPLPPAFFVVEPDLPAIGVLPAFVGLAPLPSLFPFP